MARFRKGAKAAADSATSRNLATSTPTALSGGEAGRQNHSGHTDVLPHRAHFTATHEDETEEDEAETPPCAWTVAYHGEVAESEEEVFEDSIFSYNVQTVMDPS